MQNGEQDMGMSHGEMERVDASDTDTITMSVTVDVRDLDTRDVEVLRALARLTEDSFTEIVEKNRDYGFSFLRTGCKLAATKGDPFDSAARSQTYGLLTRAGDKQERLIENVFGDGSDSVSDPAHQTAAECANYWRFAEFVLKHPDLAAQFLDE